MELTFQLSRWKLLGRTGIWREDGSEVFSLRHFPLGMTFLYNPEGEQIGSVRGKSIFLGPDIYVATAEQVKTFQIEWYQIHYYHFWTAERVPGEDSFRVTIGQGEQIGTIRQTHCGTYQYRYTLSTEDPKNFLMMVMLSLVMFARQAKPVSM